MDCRKCSRAIPDDAIYCCYCGIRQVPAKRKSAKRANGTGSVYKRGRSWTAVGPATTIYKDGKLVTYRPTQGGFSTRTEALLAAPTVGQFKKTKDVKQTFSQIYAKWLDRHKDRVSKGTLGCYTAAYKHYADLYPAPFVDLVTADWQGCVDDCTGGKRTRENMKALGTLLYKYAAEQNITDKNFAQYIYIGKMEQVSRYAFDRSELQIIADGVQKGVPYADYILCACFLGFRPLGFFNLRKEDYDPDSRTIIGGVKTEAGRRRIVPVSPIIQPCIDRLMASASDYIFPNRHGEQMTPDNYRKDYFYQCLDDLGIQRKPVPGESPKYTPYSCRHTFFTMMSRVPGEEKIKAELGGHTSYDMSKHYQHPDLADKRSIIDALQI
ncbi:MAG: tyrosine-type recombinase/integrase [Aristaeellaceae bacterium]